MSNLEKAFKSMKDKSQPSWGGYDWSKPSRAVVACDGDFHGCVLFTVGAHVNFEIKEVGLRGLDEIGLDDAPPGISIWEGITSGGGIAYDGDYLDTYLTGSFRAPTDEEWNAIRAGVCPWDDDQWKDGQS